MLIDGPSRESTSAPRTDEPGGGLALADREVIEPDAVVERRDTRGEGGSGAPSAEELWQSLFEGSPDYIFTVDLQGRITALNRTGPGRERDEFVGRTVFDLAPAED